MQRIGDRDRCTAAHEDLSAEIEDRVAIDLRQHPVERVALAESTLFDGGSAIADLVVSACDRRGVGHGTVAPRFPRVDQWTDTRIGCVVNGFAEFAVKLRFGEFVNGVEKNLCGEEQQEDSADLEESFDRNAMTVMRPGPRHRGGADDAED